jgi:MFS family permease
MAARPRLVTPLFALVAGASFAYFLSVGVLLPVIPRYIQGPLGGGSVAVGIGVGAFSLTAVVIRPLAGHLGDRHGRRLLMLGGCVVVTAVVAAYSVATSLPVLVLLRLAHGAGEAFFFTGAATVINDLAPPHRRGEALSYFSVSLYMAFALGPTLGETVLRGSHYGAVWLVSAGCAALAALLGLSVPDTRHPANRTERTRRYLHPAALAPGSVLGLGLIGLAGYLAFMPLYVKTIGLSGSRYVFVLFSASVLLVRTIGARIPDRLGGVRAGSLAMVGAATGLITIGVWHSVAGLIVGTVLFGLGNSLAFPALMSLAIDTAPDSERASVVGTFTAFFDAAQGTGAITLGVVAALTSYRGSFIAGGVACLSALTLLNVRYRTREIERPSPAGISVESSL